jgi:Protein of unknown function (DUF742)
VTDMAGAGAQSPSSPPRGATRTREGAEPRHRVRPEGAAPRAGIPPPLVARGLQQPSRVRPYALTGGRTRFGHVLLVETLVATVDVPQERRELVGGNPGDRGMPEMRAIVELCRRMRSVAEVSALLGIPLGVVRVLLSDLADQGRIRVHGTGRRGAGSPDHAILERVLSGLRRL